MRHPIDPKVDCVFKALLGAESNRDLLIHFLNAVLGADLPRAITVVEIQNPYNAKEFLDDKLTVVDVKARDAAGQQYPVEVQLLNHRDLPVRILYGWVDLYSAQIKPQQRWLKFFNEAERLDEDALPAWMQTHEMRRAMNTLKAFSENERLKRLLADKPQPFDRGTR